MDSNSYIGGHSDLKPAKYSLFQRLYVAMLKWAKHKQAPRILFFIGVIEASIFPIPPDTMLVPMVISRKDKAWYYAFSLTIATVIGGLLGYAIGYFAYETIGLWIVEKFNLQQASAHVFSLFDKYGFLAILTAGFTPIPYKIFTISAGMAKMPVLLFVIASIIGRAGRFFLVAGLVKTLGAKIEPHIFRVLDWIGWGFILLVVLLLLLL